MKRTVKEFFWLMGALIVARFIYQLAIANTAKDIGFSDTYYVDPSGFTMSYMLSSVFKNFLFVSALVYLARASYGNFRDNIVNSILLLFTGILLLLSGGDVIVLPPASEVKGVFYGRDFGGAIVYPIIKILLILIFAFTAFMIGKNSKPR
jgi:hypothetical protein